MVQEFAKRRLGERTAGRIRGRIIDDSGCVTDIYVLDHSISGIRIETPLEASISRRFNVKFGDHEHLAEIVWRKGRDLGARYVTAMDEEAFVRPAPVSTPAKRISLAELRNIARPARK